MASSMVTNWRRLITESQRGKFGPVGAYHPKLSMMIQMAPRIVTEVFHGNKVGIPPTKT